MANATGAGLCPISDARLLRLVANWSWAGATWDQLRYTRMFRILLALTLMFWGLAMSQAAEPTTNADIHKQLVGKWFEDLYLLGFHVKATATHHADGQLAIEGVAIRGKRTTKLVITGSWMVDDGKLIETVATCQPPVLRRGRQLVSDVVEISDSVFRYVNEDGDEGVRTRVAE